LGEVVGGAGILTGLEPGEGEADAVGAGLAGMVVGAELRIRKRLPMMAAAVRARIAARRFT
jgi:hypothetical protein